MQIQPTTTHILCRIHDAGRDHDSQILLPDTVEKLAPYGEVLAIGPLVGSCAVGDKVLFTPNHPIAIQHNGETLFVVNEGCIFGKYVPDNTLTFS